MSKARPENIQVFTGSRFRKTNTVFQMPTPTEAHSLKSCKPESRQVFLSAES